MRPEKLAKRFESLGRELASRIDALYFEVSRAKKAHVLSLTLRTVKLQLVYCWRWTDMAPPSVLYCRVFPSKNHPVYLHLPEVLHYLEAKDFRACYFPYIESEQRMEVCFQALTDILVEHLLEIEKIGASNRAGEILKEQLLRLTDDENTDLSDEWTKGLIRSMQEKQDWIYVMTFTTMQGYDAFLRGDRERAIKSYRKRKQNDLLPYEKELCDFLAAGGEVQPMPPECYAAAEYQKYAGQKQDWKMIFLLYPVFAVFFCALLGAVNTFLARGAWYYSGVPWWFGTILGLMPPIFGYPLLQKYLIGLVNRNNRKKAMDFFEITDHQKWLRWFSGILLAVTMGLTFWFCLAVPNMSLRLYDGYGYYYTEEENTERFEYSEVTEVYHISARYNEYGGRVERPSYVLVLSDGRYIDLDLEFGDLEGQRQVVADLFPELTILQVDSDRDLP